MRKFFRRLKRKIVYYNAVRLANKCHEKSGYRYFVVADTKGRLVVMDKKNFRILKRKHYLPNVPTNIFTDGCIYYTANRKGEYMTEKSRVRNKHWYIFGE